MKSLKIVILLLPHFSRLLRSSSVRKLNIWCLTRGRLVTCAAWGRTLPSQTRLRVRLTLAQIRIKAAVTETISKAGARTRQTQWVIAATTVKKCYRVAPSKLKYVYKSVKAVKVSVLLVLQLVRSRGKSLLEKVVKGQVCHCNANKIWKVALLVVFSLLTCFFS